MSFSLINLIASHWALRRGRQTLLTNYLLTLPNGQTFNIMGGAKIPNSRIKQESRRAVIQYEKADEIRKFQALPKYTPVLLNGKIMTLNGVYRFIGRDYIPAPTYIGVDDSNGIFHELLNGRSAGRRINFS